MLKFVDATHLNLRSKPEFGDNIVKSLYLGMPVDVTGAGRTNDCTGKRLTSLS